MRHAAQGLVHSTQQVLFLFFPGSSSHAPSRLPGPSSSSSFGLAWLLSESWLRHGLWQPLLAEAAKCQTLYNKTFFPLRAWRRAGQSDCARPSVIKVCNQPSCLMASSRLISRAHFGLRLMDDLTLWLQSNYQLKGLRPGLRGLGEVRPRLNAGSGK